MARTRQRVSSPQKKGVKDKRKALHAEQGSDTKLHRKIKNEGGLKVTIQPEIAERLLTNYERKQDRERNRIKNPRQLEMVKLDLVNHLDRAEENISHFHLESQGTIKNGHKVNFGSLYREIHCAPTTAIVEQGNSVTLYDKIFFEKPLFKKIEYLAQLNDMGFIQYLKHLVSIGLECTLDNYSELGERIKNRILEEAYDLGDKPENRRLEVIKTAIDEETKERTKK